MARTPFDLDLKQLDRFTLLLHSVYGAGKTHLLGDMLREESQRGPVRFLNVRGQDGQLSAAGMGLGPIGETIESLQDWDAVCAEYPGAKYRAVGIDGLRDLALLVMRAKVGDRLPRTGDNKVNEWGEVHFAAGNVYRMIRHLADIVVVTCPSDKYTDPVTGETRINPDMPGAQSRTCVGEFDFVAYLKATLKGPGRIDRALMLQPNSTIASRQRLPRPITADITIPEGGGGWRAFLGAVQATMATQTKGAV